jgi:hypothetical protein
MAAGTLSQTRWGLMMPPDTSRVLLGPRWVMLLKRLGTPVLVDNLQTVYSFFAKLKMQEQF